MRFITCNNLRVSKTIGTLTKRFLLFLRQTVFTHPSSPITKITKHYGNRQERTCIFKRECIPSPPSVMYASLGITTMAKKGLIKDRDKHQPLIAINCFNLSPHHRLRSLLCLNPIQKVI